MGCFVRPVSDPIGHIFDLVVRTYDPTSGTLLWEDSFEQLDRIEEPSTEPETNVPIPRPFHPGIPPLSLGIEVHETAAIALGLWLSQCGAQTVRPLLLEVS